MLVIVRLIYGSALLFGLLIFFRIPQIDYRWGPLQKSFLISMLLMAVSTFPLAHWVSRRFWPKGAILMAALGEACAVYGYALYCVSGDTRWPWLFFILCAGHYAQTMSRFDKIASDDPVRDPQNQDRPS